MHQPSVIYLCLLLVFLVSIPPQARSQSSILHRSHQYIWALLLCTLFILLTRSIRSLISPDLLCDSEPNSLLVIIVERLTICFPYKQLLSMVTAWSLASNGGYCGLTHKKQPAGSFSAGTIISSKKWVRTASLSETVTDPQSNHN